jgi:hypothetical protein
MGRDPPEKRLRQGESKACDPTGKRSAFPVSKYRPERFVTENYWKWDEKLPLDCFIGDFFYAGNFLQRFRKKRG